MGAIQGTDLSHPLTLRYLNKYNMPRQPFNRDVYFYEFNSGTAVDSNTFSAQYDPTIIATAVRTYMTLWNTYSKYLKPGFPNGIPRALSVTLQDFLEVNNLTPITPLFERAMTLSGYGHLNRVPAVYALVLVTDKVLGGASGLLSNPVWLADLPLLMTKLAADTKTRGVQFVYSAKISSVIRGTTGVRIKYSVGSNSYEEQCGKLVVAFPQMLDAMSFLGLDQQETAVFQPVIGEYYIVSMVDTIRNIGSRLYVNLLQLDPHKRNSYIYGNAHPFGQPIQFARQYPNVSNITTVYSWARPDAETHPDVDTLHVNSSTIETLQVLDPTRRTIE